MDGNFLQAVSVIEGAAIRWVNMAQTVSVDLFSRKPAPKEWSALECLVHILDTENLFASRTNAFLTGQNLPAFNPDSQGTKLSGITSPAALAAEFAKKRAANLPTLKMLTPGDLLRTSIHAELGKVTLGEMIYEWAAHDLNHTMQAERALMQPFIDSCGPWVIYFKEHQFIEK